jgi:uncharacterized protein YndB with AHSA1/START domain
MDEECKSRKGDVEMIRAEQSVFINRPPDEVFRFVSDVEKWDQWAGEMVEVRKISEGPVGVGTTFSAAVKFLGQRSDSEQEITEYEPGNRLGIRVSSGPVAGSTAVFSFESVEGGTKVTEAVEGETGGLWKVADPLLARMIERQYATNLGNLKDLLEAQAEGGA